MLALSRKKNEAIVTVEKRPDSRRSVLRKRYVSDRGGDDRSQHCSGNEPIVYG